MSGLVIYILIELDKRYFSKEETQTYSSLRIATAISLVVYIAVTYFKCSACVKSISKPFNQMPSSPSVTNQQILNEPF
jgi:hypothetical protein